MKRILIYLAIFSLCMQSCANKDKGPEQPAKPEDNKEVSEPKFDFINYQITEAKEQKEIYEDGVLVGVGMVPVYKVTFNFTESADDISIYPGDVGGDFAYRDGRVARLNRFDFSFNTNVSFGTQDPKTQFFVMASPDYDGRGTFESIQAATWIDITNLFTIPDRLPTNKDYKPSGSVSLLDSLGKYGSLNLAFKYIVNNQIECGEYTAIRIQKWNLSSGFEFMEGVQSLDLNWALTEGEGITPGRNSISATTITFRGNMGYNNGEPKEENRPNVEMRTEAWGISSKFSASEVDMGADKATDVKKFGDPSISSYTYTYDKPGEYDAVFMISNVNEKNENKVVYKTVHVSIPESPETTD